MEKKRLDICLNDQELVPTRSQARSLIKNGSILVNGAVVKKPGFLISTEDQIEVTEEIFVGRGALKLRRALEDFNIRVDGLVAADIGASTGGFTEILLKNGAKKVYAIDVGHDQLAKSLLSDERVINREGINVKYPIDLDELCDLAVIDLSFISLRKVIINIKNIISTKGQIIALIKPQFEVGPEKLGKNGIVKNESDRIAALEDLKNYFIELDFTICGVIDSPIQGKEGNREFLIHLRL